MMKILGKNIVQSVVSLLSVLVLILIQISPNFGQVVSSVIPSKDTTEMGDRVTLNIRISIPQNSRPQAISFKNWISLENDMYLRDSIRYEPTADLEILEGGPWNITDLNKDIPFDPNKFQVENGQLKADFSIQIAIYNAGRFLFKGPDILSDSTILSMPTESRYITVTWPKTMSETDSLVLEPIKDIMKEPVQLSDYWGYIAALLLLLAIIGYFYYRKKYKKNVEVMQEPEPEVVVPAHILALEALKKLELQQLWQQGLVKEYQTELTAIIRNYLENRYNIHAQKLTTDEIIVDLHHTSLSEDQKSELREILNVADLVKFAKAQPDTDIHNRFMDKAKIFVEKTQSTFGETTEKTKKE